MKEQKWFTHVKYSLLSLNTSWTLVFCIDTHVYKFKCYWHKEGKGNMSANEEYISVHR